MIISKYGYGKAKIAHDGTYTHKQTSNHFNEHFLSLLDWAIQTNWHDIQPVQSGAWQSRSRSANRSSLWVHPVLQQVSPFTSCSRRCSSTPLESLCRVNKRPMTFGEMGMPQQSSGIDKVKHYLSSTTSMFVVILVTPVPDEQPDEQPNMARLDLEYSILKSLFKRTLITT